MITLEKLLTELKAESLNEIVAAGGKHKGKCGKRGKGGGSSKTGKSWCKSYSSKSTNSGSCS